VVGNAFQITVKEQFSLADFASVSEDFIPRYSCTAMQCIGLIAHMKVQKRISEALECCYFLYPEWQHQINSCLIFVLFFWDKIRETQHKINKQKTCLYKCKVNEIKEYCSEIGPRSSSQHWQLFSRPHLKCLFSPGFRFFFSKNKEFGSYEHSHSIRGSEWSKYIILLIEKHSAHAEKNLNNKIQA
jgi:hypothetical protein